MGLFDPNNDIFNQACRELPEDWRITIQLENGCGDVELQDPTGDEKTIHLDDSTLEQTIRYAIDEAIRRDPEYTA